MSDRPVLVTPRYFEVPREPETESDFYKMGHIFQYPDRTNKVYSNLTCRSTKWAPAPHIFPNQVVNYGHQMTIKKWLINDWNKYFFDVPLKNVIDRFESAMNEGLGGIPSDHIRKLHQYGRLPLLIKGLPEGEKVSVGIPLLTFVNTRDEFFWFTNYIESAYSCEVWAKICNATIAYKYRILLDRYAELTGGSKEFVPFQGHDFSFRGMKGIVDAMECGTAHNLSFHGTDTVPSIRTARFYYPEKDGQTCFIGGSCPATEHSVMCMGLQGGEKQTILDLIRKYPTGILSIVSDTWDFWHVITVIAQEIKEEILNRKPNQYGLAKLVFRPDSGDPVKIICGDPEAEPGSPAYKGAVQCLWEVFGGTVNSEGYSTLNQRVGLIYGDSITLDRAERILKGLMAKGFASDNVVLGIGSYTYQYNTRDTFSIAIKSTFGEVDHEPRILHKAPVTDSGTKFSARGLLRVDKINGVYILRDNVTSEEEAGGALVPIFREGELLVNESFSTIRDRLGTFRKVV